MGIEDNALVQCRTYYLKLSSKLSSYSRFKNTNSSCSKIINLIQLCGHILI